MVIVYAWLEVVCLQKVNGNLVVAVVGVGLTVVGGILVSKLGDACILAAEKGNFKADTKDFKDTADRAMDIWEPLLSLFKNERKVIDVSEYQET
jgi:hypothetical protein